MPNQKSEVTIGLAQLLIVGTTVVALGIAATIRFSANTDEISFGNILRILLFDLFSFSLAGILSTFIFTYIFKRRTELQIIHDKIDMFFSNKFQKVSIEQFLNTIDFEEIDTIEVIGHTGEQLITSLLSKINDKDYLNLHNIKIKILLRDPYFEIGKRSKGINRIIDKIHDFQEKGYKNIHYKFYTSLPTFRSMLCIPKDPVKGRIAFLGFYYFPNGGPSKRFSHSIIVDQRISENFKLIDIVESWFKHLWGKNDELRKHTIIFDFDDTIANSHKIQISAWEQIVKEATDCMGIKNKNINQETKSSIAKIFFEKQNAKDIFNSIFKNLDYNVVDKLHQRRFQIRSGNMSATDVPLFNGAKDVLRELSKHYNLIIVSATDEDMIINYLKKKEIYHYFWYVFGKREPIYSWMDIERKSQLLFKIVGITGVPINRLVYIGDNNGDFKASQRINIDFIEARLFQGELEELINKESLIFDNSPRKFFTNWGNLPELIREFDTETIVDNHLEC